jgi:hypothetical protein
MRIVPVLIVLDLTIHDLLHFGDAELEGAGRCGLVYLIASGGRIDMWPPVRRLVPPRIRPRRPSSTSR